MKTKFMLLAFVCFFSQHVFSQWTDTGTVIYTNDHVGVGTNLSSILK